MVTENLSTLKIHKLSQAQYDRELEAGNIDETALYLTPDGAVLYTPQSLTEEQQEIARNNIGAMGTTANSELDMNTFNIKNIESLVFAPQDDSSPSAYITREHYENGRPYLRLGENDSDGRIDLRGVQSIDIKDSDGSGVVLEADDVGLYILNHLNSGEPLNLFGVECLHLNGGTIKDVNELRFSNYGDIREISNVSYIGFTKNEEGNCPKIGGTAYDGSYQLEFVGSANDEPVRLSNVAEPISYNDAATKAYVDTAIGNIESVLDNIIAMQENLIGGESA